MALQLLPRSQWVAPSSVVLQDEGKAKDDEAAEQEADEEAAVIFFFFFSGFDQLTF